MQNLKIRKYIFVIVMIISFCVEASEGWRPWSSPWSGLEEFNRQDTIYQVGLRDQEEKNQLIAVTEKLEKTFLSGQKLKKSPKNVLTSSQSVETAAQKEQRIAAQLQVRDEQSRKDKEIFGLQKEDALSAAIRIEEKLAQQQQQQREKQKQRVLVDRLEQEKIQQEKRVQEEENNKLLEVEFQKKQQEGIALAKNKKVQLTPQAEKNRDVVKLNVRSALTSKGVLEEETIQNILQAYSVVVDLDLDFQSRLLPAAFFIFEDFWVNFFDAMEYIVNGTCHWIRNPATRYEASDLQRHLYNFLDETNFCMQENFQQLMLHKNEMFLDHTDRIIAVLKDQLKKILNLQKLYIAWIDKFKIEDENARKNLVVIQAFYDRILRG